MAIRSRLAGSGASATSHPVTLPAGVQAGDRLIVGVTSNSSGVTVSATDWTQLGTTQSQGANHSFSVWTRVATGTDSLTIGLSTAQVAQWVAICLQGDGGTPETPAFASGASATTATVTAITGLASGDYDSLVFLALDNGTAVNPTGITAPTGWNNLTNDTGNATHGVLAFSMEESSAGVTGFSPSNATWTNAEQWITAHIVVPQASVGGGGGVVPTVRSAAGASGAAGNDPAVVTKPAGLAVGDLMIAVHVGDNDVALANMTGPSGWTTIASQAGVSGAQPAVKVWQRVATSTETAASSFSFAAGGGGVFCSAGILAITAGTFNTTTPIGASPSFTINAANSTTHTAPSLTGIVDGLLITGHSVDSGGAASCSYTPPSGMTERVDTAASSGWTCLEINTLVLTSTAATGAKNATCTSNRPATSVSLIVNPAPSNTARRTGGFLALL